MPIGLVSAFPWLMLLAMGTKGQPAGDGGNKSRMVETYVPIKGIEWIDDKEVKVLGKKEQSAAFRDIVVERTGQRVFDSFMEKVRNPEDYGYQVLRDPMPLAQDVHFTKKSGLLNIKMEASDMLVRGFKGLQLTYIRVIRHFGLRDVKVILRLGTDLTIEGNYKLDGTALSFLPVTGNGHFAIKMQGFSVSAVTFLVLRDKENSDDQTLVIRELDLQVAYLDVHFDFQNLMGGGVLGSAANAVINAIGEAIVNSQKMRIITELKNNFKEQVSMFL